VLPGTGRQVPPGRGPVPGRGPAPGLYPPSHQDGPGVWHCLVLQPGKRAGAHLHTQIHRCQAERYEVSSCHGPPALVVCTGGPHSTRKAQGTRPPSSTPASRLPSGPSCRISQSNGPPCTPHRLPPHCSILQCAPIPPLHRPARPCSSYAEAAHTHPGRSKGVDSQLAAGVLLGNVQGGQHRKRSAQRVACKAYSARVRNHSR